METLMNTPLLTIITINYNNAEGLKRTVKSVLSQSINDYSLIEYLIIDGASTDESVTFLKEIDACKGQFNLFWTSEPDSGIYNAMNKGIKKAHGKYIHMLNSGDYLEENILNDITEKLKKDPDLLLCGLNLVENSEIIKTEVRYPEHLYFGSMSHQGMIYKKSLHDIHGLYDESYRFASDYDFSIKAFYKKPLKIEALYKPCVNFICGGVGASDKSMKELEDIKIKAGITVRIKPNYFKKFIKLFMPYGLYFLYKKISK